MKTQKTLLDYFINPIINFTYLSALTSVVNFLILQKGDFTMKMKTKFKSIVFSLAIIFFLVYLNSAAQAGWEKTYGGPDSDYGRSVQQTKDGGFIIAGSTNSFGAGEADVYLVKTDALGKMEWQKTFVKILNFFTGGAQKAKGNQYTKCYPILKQDTVRQSSKHEMAKLCSGISGYESKSF